MDSDQRVASIKHWTRSRWDWCHEWMMRFIQHRVADPRILHLIQKWLKAGVLEEGKRSETKVGTPQGAVISPLLANIYLHYVYDQWVEGMAES
jgi:RNA-directed DNA polymerase